MTTSSLPASAVPEVGVALCDGAPLDRQRIVFAFAAALTLAAILAGGVAIAYWTTAGGAGGSGAGSAATVERGATPVATTTEEGSVTVDWDVTTLSNGHPTDGYLVRRYDSAIPAAPTILASCSGTITQSVCVESGVPPGDWVYSVTPVIGANWRGAESPMSNPVTTTNAGPPVNAITATNITGGVFKGANTIFYRGESAGSFTLTNAVSDAGTGPASSSTSHLAGTTSGWTHTPSTVSSPADGPYVSDPFSWTADTTSAPTEVVTGRDEDGNGTDTTLTFVDDSTSPESGTISYRDGYQPEESVTVSFTAGTDTGARTPHTEFSGDLDGRTFHAGVHHTATALALTGTVVLDGEGSADAVFIFQLDAALNTAAASQVSLINGASASNVYWQVEGAAGTGANSIFAGTILAAGAITLGDGTHLTGAVLAHGTVTLATNTVVFAS